MKRALVVGIDDYPGNPLAGCVNDASAVGNLLEKNGDGSPNFSVMRLLSSDQAVTSERLHDAVTQLFASEADIALLFFAGHGIALDENDTAHLVSQDGRRGGWGMSMSDLMAFSNRPGSKVRATVIVLDCCHSGFAGEAPGIGAPQVAHMGNGVTILTACHRDQLAAEDQGHGLFTEILLDGLAGSSADILGRITPAALYSHIDQTLGAWQQRPLYKANVSRFIVLREIAPKIPKEVLRRLPNYFPDAAFVFPLDPSYEPDRANVPCELRDIPVNEEHARIFKELQLCNRHGLVIPDAEHMYYAAIKSTSCRLTALGAHYRNLAALGHI